MANEQEVEVSDYTELYFVVNGEDWLYSSAADYAGKKVYWTNNSRGNMKGSRSYAAKGYASFLRQTGHLSISETLKCATLGISPSVGH